MIFLTTSDILLAINWNYIEYMTWKEGILYIITKGSETFSTFKDEESATRIMEKFTDEM